MSNISLQQYAELTIILTPIPSNSITADVGKQGNAITHSDDDRNADVGQQGNAHDLHPCDNTQQVATVGHRSAAILMDSLHPGELKGKRKRKQKVEGTQGPPKAKRRGRQVK
ncbi:hypothetical protein AC249_AIPGENE12442 [Exaiptasia diaphana]|nr:hypothetical protein AC249_AIPGENE12442 [Exaiptasia diaphana]